MNGKFLVTGGAGFVGSNLANNLLSDGSSVTIFDSLSREGAQNNLAWLRSQHGKDRLNFIQADVRDFLAIRSAVKEVDVIYHLAGQVAVTSSVCDPRLDFEINSLGTLNVLEAARLSGRKPIVVFTSTNKVYGEMESVATVELGYYGTYSERFTVKDFIYDEKDRSCRCPAGNRLYRNGGNINVNRVHWHEVPRCQIGVWGRAY
jgi:CDP-paratose 2-epimerase